MKVFKYISGLMFVLLSSLAYAQDSGQTAAKLFASGQYSDAAKMYELAASVNSSQSQKTKYYDMAKKCRLCASYSAEANSLFKQGKYDAAETSYRKILAINPNDASANAKIRKIAGQREAAKLALERKKQEEAALDEYKVALSSRNSKKLSSWAQKYSGMEKSGMVQEAVACLSSDENMNPVRDRIDFYLKCGDMFAEDGDDWFALQFYDMAASLASVEGIMKKASLSMGNAKKGGLLRYAAVAGNEEAKQLLASNGLRCDEKYYNYENLAKFGVELIPTIQVLSSSAPLYFDRLPKDRAYEMIARADIEELKAIKKIKAGKVYYDVAQECFNKGKYDFGKKMLEVSVLDGYTEAAKLYYEKYKFDNTEISQLCKIVVYEYLPESYDYLDRKYLLGYMEFLRGAGPSRYVSGTLRSIGIYDQSVFYDRHDHLIGDCAGLYKYSTKSDFDEINTLLAKYDCWDKDVVEQCIGLLKKNKPKKYKKVVSKLEKLNVVQGVKAKEPSPLKPYADSYYFENLY